MAYERPFVVTVASEKGGVGKTTVATNLAVYLKALREDLPVTVASFDNHFTVDNMFSLGGNRGGSVAELFSGLPPSGLVQLGQYGVQYLASSHGMVPPDDDPRHLARVLADSSLPGILVLDTRPVLDYFTRNALLASDLVLVPVKDRPSLMNAASLHRLLSLEGDDPGKIWILPSLIDRRLRLRGEVGMEEFLTFSAHERGYQVMETALSKSPRVEGLATGFSSRVYPVITHASGTVVHREFRRIADFVLARRDGSAPGTKSRIPASVPPGGRRLKSAPCPVCGRLAEGERCYLFQSLRRRRLGFVHASCVEPLLETFEIPYPPEAEGVLALMLEGTGFSGEEAGVAWLMIYFDEERAGEGRFVVDPSWEPFLEESVGRSLVEMTRDCLFLVLYSGPPDYFLSGEGRACFHRLRRAALKEAAPG